MIDKNRKKARKREGIRIRKRMRIRKKIKSQKYWLKNKKVQVLRKRVMVNKDGKKEGRERRLEIEKLKEWEREWKLEKMK